MYGRPHEVQFLKLIVAVFMDLPIITLVVPLMNRPPRLADYWEVKCTQPCTCKNGLQYVRTASKSNEHQKIKIKTVVYHTTAELE